MFALILPVSVSTYAVELTLKLKEEMAEILYEQNISNCPNKPSPDGPFRAIRHSDGSVIGYLPGKFSFSAEVSSGGAIDVNCRPVMKGDHISDPDAHNDRVWLASAWIDDDDSIHALGHNEYHAHSHPTKCRFSSYLECWYNTITHYRWDTNSKTFALNKDNKPVISPYFDQSEYQGRHRGFFNPTNVISSGDYYYFLIETTGGGKQPRGVCIFRRNKDDPPWDWKALTLDGSFSRLTLRLDPSLPTAICKTIANLQGPITSIFHDPTSDKFVSIFVGRTEETKESVILYAVSKDLFNWEKPRILSRLPLMWSKSCSDEYRFAYPSVIDYTSSSRNLDSIASAPFLYLTRFHVENCRLSETRDLIRLPLHLNIQ